MDWIPGRIIRPMGKRSHLFPTGAIRNGLGRVICTSFQRPEGRQENYQKLQIVWPPFWIGPLMPRKFMSVKPAVPVGGYLLCPLMEETPRSLRRAWVTIQTPPLVRMAGR